MIRWFQIQPDTYVGLHTGRPESLRADTLRSLNELGQAYRVSFNDELLHMNKALPQNIQLVWHGINDEVNLRQFLASDIRWESLTSGGIRLVMT